MDQIINKLIELNATLEIFLLAYKANALTEQEINSYIFFTTETIKEYLRLIDEHTNKLMDQDLSLNNFLFKN